MSLLLLHALTCQVLANSFGLCFGQVIYQLPDCCSVVSGQAVRTFYSILESIIYFFRQIAVVWRPYSIKQGIYSLTYFKAYAATYAKYCLPNISYLTQSPATQITKSRTQACQFKWTYFNLALYFYKNCSPGRLNQRSFQQVFEGTAFVSIYLNLIRPFGQVRKSITVVCHPQDGCITDL